MIQKKSIFLCFLFLVFHSQFASAKSFPVTARFFIGSTLAEPDNLNQELVAQGLEDIDAVAVFGLEATYTALKHFEVGIRYTKRMANQEENPKDPATSFSGELNQDSVLLLARYPFLKSKIVRADIFAGVGGSNTTFKILTATQDGELTRKEAGDWFATPYASAGASIAIGYKSVYFTIEGGYETNKVDDFKRTGNVNTNVSAIDLSGGYFTIGLLIDGLSATSGSSNK